MGKKTSAFFKTGLMLFLIAAVSLMAVISFTSCIRFTGFTGSGNRISQERDVLGFEGVSVSAGMNLYIEQTGTESLRIEADDNVIPRILTEINNKQLTIRYKPWTMGLGGINTAGPVNIYLTVKDINSIKASSGANFDCSKLKTGDLEISLSSGSHGEALIEAENLFIRLASGSTLNIAGSVKKQDINLSSGVDYDAENLVSEDTRLDVSSGAVATVNSNRSLDVNISSGGLVRYKGSPQIMSDISSGGSLKNITDN